MSYRKHVSEHVYSLRSCMSRRVLNERNRTLLRLVNVSEMCGYFCEPTLIVRCRDVVLT